MELNCERDITEEHRQNLLMNSLAWVTHRLRKIHENGGPESGNLHHTDGKPYGFFAVSKCDETSGSANLEEENKLLREQLAASRWNADDLCKQRNRLRAFVEQMHGHAKMVEIISPNEKGQR